MKSCFNNFPFYAFYFIKKWYINCFVATALRLTLAAWWGASTAYRSLITACADNSTTTTTRRATLGTIRTATSARRSSLTAWRGTSVAGRS
jgi:hypothetical protein